MTFSDTPYPTSPATHGPTADPSAGTAADDADRLVMADGTDAADQVANEPEQVAGRKSPQRRCIVTGQVQPKDGLIRFVVGPGDIMVADLAENLPGRGYWLTAQRDSLLTAVGKRAFARAARRAVTIADDLETVLVRGLIAQVLGTVGMARRAGQAIAGSDKLAEWLPKAPKPWLYHAMDAAPDGCRRLDGLVDAPCRQRLVLNGAMLGQGFGRSRVAHFALVDGGLRRRLHRDLDRLSGFVTSPSFADLTTPDTQFSSDPSRISGSTAQGL